MIEVTLYTHTGCGLCRDAAAMLTGLAARYPHQLTTIDIESDAELLANYFDKVPVVVIGSHTLHAPITRADIQIAFARATAAR